MGHGSAAGTGPDHDDDVGVVLCEARHTGKGPPASSGTSGSHFKSLKPRIK